MKFIPSPPARPTSQIQHQYFWQAGNIEKGEFHLFLGVEKVASLWLNRNGEMGTVMEVAQEVFEFSDSSTFFNAKLLLLGKESRSCSGRIERNTTNPLEGTIKLEEQVYGWKFHGRPDPCLLLMDQERRRLFSYHYTPTYVRLILNKPGKEEEQLVPLLCIGLYLLPVWHNSKECLNGRNQLKVQEKHLEQRLSLPGF